MKCLPILKLNYKNLNKTRDGFKEDNCSSKYNYLQ